MRPGRDDRSPEALAYRRLYKDVRWCGKRGRRAQQLLAHPLCERCLAKGIVNDGSLTMDGRPQPTPRRRYLVANHKIAHRGDERLFFEGELETLCPDHHDVMVQKEEHGRVVEEINPLTGLPFA
jgi:5-methylcytosine-specific restriction protein A